MGSIQMHGNGNRVMLVLLFGVSIVYAEIHCRLSKTNTCPLNQIKQRTRIFPGGSTRCADGSPYSFQVLPGRGASWKKALMYFQEGGGCFDSRTCEPTFNKLIEAATSHRIYRYKVDPMPLRGILNRTDALNPFRDYTLVLVHYCTADVHIGSIIKPTIFFNDGVYHSGGDNVRSVLDWFFANFKDPKRIVMAGSSAGSIGVQIWSRVVSRHYEHLNVPISVIADSYVGVLPHTKNALLPLNWGSCNIDLAWTPELLVKCKSGTLEFQEFVKQTIISSPKVDFTFIYPRHDDVQRKFYCLVEHGIKIAKPHLFMKDLKCLSAKEFDERASNILEKYRSETNGTIHSYTVEGDGHIILSGRLFSSKVATKPNKDCEEQPTLVGWLTRVVERKPVQIVPYCYSSKYSTRHQSVQDSSSSVVFCMSVVWIWVISTGFMMLY